MNDKPCEHRTCRWHLCNGGWCNSMESNQDWRRVEKKEGAKPNCFKDRDSEGEY